MLQRSNKMAGVFRVDKMADALWIAAAVLTLLSPLPVSCKDYTDFRCPDSSNCSCTIDGLGFYEVLCPSTGSPSIKVKVISGKYVGLDCMSSEPDAFSILPQLSFPDTDENIESFSFNKCPLPDVPFGEIINRLGFSKVRAVMFQSYGKNLSNTLKRHHLKGLEGVTRLVLTTIGMSDLAEDTFDDMANLTWLNLRSNKVHLRPGLFRSLTHLNLLELGQNELPNLPPGLFRHLGSLNQLNLWQNSLTNLSKETFEGLNTLEGLDLSSNGIETLPADVFHDLPSLKDINLYANNLSSLPEDLFAKNSQLQQLKLSNNKQDLMELPKGLLSNLPKLSRVWLNRCRISVLPESLFWNSTGIKNISLEENSLTRIPQNLFRDQINLTMLDLSNNEIMSIPDGAFQFLMKLEVLKLNNNKLTKISGKIFGYLTSLKELRIRNNHLREIDSNAFMSPRNIEFIDLAYNNLTLMESNLNIKFAESFDVIEPRSPFHILKNLTHLNLSHNSITEVFNDWKTEIPSLTDLDLSFNKFFTVKFEDLNFLSNKIDVDLRNNNISVIDFKLANAVYAANTIHEKSRSTDSVKVFIDQNPVNCDCILYGFVRYLQNMLHPVVRGIVTVHTGRAVCATPKELQGRLLTEVEEHELLCPLDDPSSTYDKKLCPNNCTCSVRVSDRAIIVGCSGTYSLSTINLPKPKLIGLNYTEVHFENNRLQDLSILSSNSLTFNEITQLYVAGNNISHLSVEDIPNNIEYLDLRNNLLKHINTSVADLLSNSTTLKQVLFSGNPLICDCDNLPFLSFLQTNYAKVKDFSNITCPDGQIIQRVALGKLCGATPTVIAISVVMVIISLILGISAALFYKYNREIVVWLFANRLCLCCVSEKELDKDKLYDAFISFSHKDEEFIVNKLVPELEKGPNPFKICLHFRDWVAGEWIPTQIANSVEASRRTLVVLSPNFLESVWGRMEFRAAHCQAIKEGRARVIIILYGDIGPTDNLEPELQAYLRMNTYLKWGDPWFWDKLRYALPHPQIGKNLLPAQNVIKKKGFDDRLELIHPTTPSTPPGQNTPPAHQAHSNPLMNHVSTVPNGIKQPCMMNGTITMNGLKVNGNAKHSDV